MKEISPGPSPIPAITLLRRRLSGAAAGAAAGALVAACGSASDGANTPKGPGSPATENVDGSAATSAADAGALSTVTAEDAGTSASNDAAATRDAASDSGGASDAGSREGPSDSGTSVLDATSPPSAGSIQFHILIGVDASGAIGDTLTLTGDNYTDLIMSNFIAGVMYGQLIEHYSPGMLFNKDYLYGSLFGQLLQENISTESYLSSSLLIDSSPLQQAVMGNGQGGPYQINNYAADMVYGSYSPDGYSLINYVALQKNIGYSFASAATQYAQITPPAFNNKYYGPMLTAYFHFNDYVALQEIGPVGGYVPAWEPAYDNTLATFKTLPNNFLDILLNAAYNQGYYGPLVSSISQTGATATATTVATVDGYSSVWGIDDTYQQYPYQVRYYLDQLYDNPIPTTSVAVTTTPTNHVLFGMASLGVVFANVFETLAYEDPASGYRYIRESDATAAFASALAASSLSMSDTLDLSNGTDRAKIFTLLEQSISTLQTNLATDFTARTTTAL